MSDETIPLYDGELSGQEIIPETSGGLGTTKTLRGGRKRPRKRCDHVHVCFSPNLHSGRIEHVECPVLNMSSGGFSIEFDRNLDPGVTGYISYRTIAHMPVRVSCTVRRCRPLGNGRCLLGIVLDRPLKVEERRPARVGRGRELAPGIRARQLRDLGTEPTGE